MTDAAKAPIDIEAQRVKFEAAYVGHMNDALETDRDAAYMAGLRVGDDYGPRAYLNGAWKGWQMCAAAGQS